jgi:hypothetical protein
MVATNASTSTELILFQPDRRLAFKVNPGELGAVFPAALIGSSVIMSSPRGMIVLPACMEILVFSGSRRLLWSKSVEDFTSLGRDGNSTAATHETRRRHSNGNWKPEQSFAAIHLKANERKSGQRAGLLMTGSRSR